MEANKKIAIIVPTLNPGKNLEQWIKAVKIQSLIPDVVMVVDSSSDDNTVEICKKNGFQVLAIKRSDFNHGKTRQKAVDKLAEIDIAVFLTQDAILANSDALQKLVDVFDEPNIGAAYGRQLPNKNAKPTGAFARLFNYPPESHTYSKDDIEKHGIKTAYLSNSFAAYRVPALQEAGGFPSNVIFGEDMYVAAKILLDDLSIAYVGDACVYHSHDYTIMQEFKRYFDMGVFHNREPWLLKELGSPHGEGKRYVSDELKYLARHAFWLVPSALIRTGFKYLGYKLGTMEDKMPIEFKKSMSMHKGYWDNL